MFKDTRLNINSVKYYTQSVSCFSRTIRIVVNYFRHRAAYYSTILFIGAPGSYDFSYFNYNLIEKSFDQSSDKSNDFTSKTISRRMKSF